MTAHILDGKALAANIRQELKAKIAKLPTLPHLAVIMVGNNPASIIYVRNKLKAAAEIGIQTSLHEFSAEISQQEIIDLIHTLNQDSSINGIMIQLPLPKHLNESEILKTISPQKDVDGFHPYNIGLLQSDDSQAMIAATPKGIMRLLEHTDVELSGKQALVIGRSQIVGKPIALLLLNKDCTVTIAHSKTTNLQALIKNADIVIAACGCPEFIKGSWLKENSTIIDVGINHLDGRLCGDVEFSTAVEKAAIITPVPKGVGPMTIAMLLENTFEAYLKQN